MKIIVSIQYSAHPLGTVGQWTQVQAESRRLAVKIIERLRANNIGAQISWLPETAADIRRETDRSRAWAEKCWHFEEVPESKAKHQAIRRWARVVNLKDKFKR